MSTHQLKITLIFFCGSAVRVMILSSFSVCSTTGAGLGDIYQHADKGASQVQYVMLP